MGRLLPPPPWSPVGLCVALLLGLSWAEEGLGCPQGCTCERWEVACTGGGLDRVPSAIPLTTKVLVLANNSLASLPPMEMSYLNDLVYLDCSRNLLHMSFDFTFPRMVKLTYLDLSFNRILRITPRTFSQLQGLLLLNLSSNPTLVEIKAHAFDSNPLLRYLDLRACGLTSVGADTFRQLHNLHSLGLAENPWSCDCSLLEFCNWMKKAHVQYPDPERTLCQKPDNVRGLQVLEGASRIHYTCFVHLELGDFAVMALIAFCIFFGGTLAAWLVGISAVIYYHPVPKVNDESEDEDWPPKPSHDPAAEPASGSAMAKRVRTVNQRHVWMVLLLGICWRAEGGGCPEACVCQYLSVNCTDKQLEDFPAPIPLDTRQLVLARNRLSYLPSVELNFLSDLIYLDCSGNALGEDLDFAFVSIIKLVYLDLSFNNLTQVTFSTFSQLSSLVVLKLSDNPGLVEIEKDSFANNTWLRHLDVSRCRLTFLDTSTVRDLPNLRSLAVSGNPWFCNCSFMGLSSWVKESGVTIPDPDNVTCYGPAFMHGLRMLAEAQEQLHFRCHIHLDDRDYLFLGLVGFCIFSAGTVLAWLLGVCAVIYEVLTATGEDEEEEEEEAA
ncbi:SLIT and NTRK-like protein 6 [Varanus komodoensis]|uniref:SLIT and NTRK-like protein 6 n=1 Tax=Varanus komodoensis TaxID=61221 RepID=UPI001CF7D78F|nr:SLIT and NTRK-like protein 6 [Varanus komodoensis]